MLKRTLRIAIALWLGSACEGRLESDGISRAAPPAADPQRAADGGLPPATATPTPPPGSNADAGLAADAGTGSEPPRENATLDASADDAAATQEERGMLCGAPPYQAIRLSARDIMDPGKRGDIPGVNVTFKHCPGRVFALKRNVATVQVSVGAETWIRFDAPDYLPWVEGELRVPEQGMPALEATMVPLAFVESVVPAWRPDVALVYVDVRVGRTGAVDACRSAAGVALAVKDHPQALVLYRGKGANPGYLSVAGTTEEGVAVIANLPAQASIELLASKPGCQYQTALGDANSETLVPLVRAPLFPGALTHQIVNPIR